MSVISDLKDRVAEYNNGLTTGLFIQNIILDNESYIVDLNAEVQLYERGENNLGVSIADYMPYSPLTIEIKRQKHQPTNRVTLRDEGDFESSFFIEANGEQFEIKASDWKTEELIKKYGRQILGLTDEHLEELIHDILYPELLEKAYKIIYESN